MTLIGQSLAELQFRQTYGATVIEIRRGKKNITPINPLIQLKDGDCLIVVSKTKPINKLKVQDL